MKKLGQKSLSFLLVLLMLFSTCALMLEVNTVSAARYSVADTKQKVFDFLMNEMGFNSAAAAGVMANIEKECSWNYQLIEEGWTFETGGYGLCQWTNTPRGSATGRRTSLVNYCNSNGYDYTSLEGQLAYLKYELNTKNYYSKVTSKLLAVPNTAQGCYDAGYRWCYSFEVPEYYKSNIPGEDYTRSEERGMLARDVYWPVWGRSSVSYSGSSSYMGGKYYTALKNVQLTGNQRTDIVNIAKSQVGYYQGSSSSDLSGSGTYKSKGHCEYNYWAINKKNQTWLSTNDYWCQTFVCWCASLAGVDTDVINLTAATTSGYKFFKNQGRVYTADQIKAGTYTPQSGDIIYFKCGSNSNPVDHVGIVTGISGNTIYTLEGNTSSTTGGSQRSGGTVAAKTRSLTSTSCKVIAVCSPNYETTSSSSGSGSNSSSTKVTLTLKHMTKDLNGSGYSCAATDTYTVDKGTVMTLPSKSMNGFTLEGEEIKRSIGTSLTYSYYYSRNKYTVSLSKGSGISAVSGAGTYYYGQSVTISATPSSGYRLDKWTPSTYSSGFTTSLNQTYTFTMRASNVTYTASAAKIADIKYESMSYTTDGDNLYVTLKYSGAGSASDISSILFPTWTINNGQDELIWYKCENFNATTATITIPISEHNNERGDYVVDAYMTPKGGSQTLFGRLYAYIDDVGPEISEFTTSKTGKSFTIKGKVVDSGVGVDSVKAYVWGPEGFTDGWYNLSFSGDTINHTFNTNVAGVYTIHVYSWDKYGNQGNGYPLQVQLDTTAPEISNVRFEYDENGYKVLADVTDNEAISEVRFPTWTVTSGQDDLAYPWSLGNHLSGNTYYYYVKYSDHNDEYGTYMNHIYAYDLAGNSTGYDGGNVVREKDPPVLKGYEAKCGENGFTLSISPEDVSGIRSVSFKVRHSSLAENLAQTYSCEQTSDGTWSVFVPFEDHDNLDGDYSVTAVVYDVQLNKATGIYSAHADLKAPEISDYSITLDPDGYTVTCKVTDDDTGVDRVMFPTWTSSGGQDDLAPYWSTNSSVKGVASGDTYTFKVKCSEHNGELGIYNTDIYAYDNSGNVSTVHLTKTLSDTAKFTVNHYLQNLDGKTYSLKDTVSANGYSLKSATAAVKSYTGFNSPATTTRIINLDGSTVVNYYYTRNKYDLKLVEDSGVKSLTGGGTYYFGEDVTVSATLETGYAWSKWTSSSSNLNGNSKADYSFTMPAETVTLTANTTVNDYTVTYVVDGKTYQTQTISYGSKVTAPTAPEKKGYAFIGWTNLPAAMPAQDVTVTAKYQQVEFTVTYYVDDEVYDSQSYAYGETITPIAEPVNPGYDFSGWQEVPKTMPANNISVHGTFDASKYLLTYIVDGELYHSELLAYGDSVKLPADPKREGYTFNGWSTAIPATMPAQNYSVIGSFSLSRYTATYYVDNEVYSSITYALGDTIITPAEPEKVGSTFSGWDADYTQMPAKDISIYGTMIADKHTVSYVIDGETYATKEYGYLETVSDLAVPEKEGYSFSGWTSLPEKMPNNDITVNGTYNKNSYTVTYKVNGQVYTTETYAYGAEIQPITAPDESGRTFSGWSVELDTMPAHDIVVEALYSGKTFIIKYYIDGEHYISEQYAYGDTISEPEVFDRDGHTFSGWAGIPATMPAEDIEVNGSFTPNEYQIHYIVDGEHYITETYAYGEEITPVTEPEREGYTFSGWSDIPVVMCDDIVVVSGEFTVNTYTLTYFLNDELYAEYTLEYGEEVPAIGQVDVPGYTFLGWSDIPSTMPANSVEVYGEITPNSYTITYYLNDEVYATQTLPHGTEVVAEEEPDAPDTYHFSGWIGVPDIMPGYDVDVYGTFEPNMYTVTYYVDGEYYAERTFKEGSETNLISEPEERAGFRFSGWSEIPDTMPAEDISVYGTFTERTYNISYYVNDELYASEDYSYGDLVTPVDGPVVEGYTFFGWSEIPTTMPANDVVVTGRLRGLTYTVTYLINGEIVATAQYEQDEPIEYQPAPERQGYTFEGWRELPSTMPSENISVNGYYTANKYNINYYDGTTLVGTDVLTYGTYSNLAEAAEFGISSLRPGLKYVGWALDSDAEQAVYTDGENVVNLCSTDGDTLNLYSAWEPITYKINYYDIDNVTLKGTSEVTYGEEVELTSSTTLAITQPGTGSRVMWATESSGTAVYEDGASVMNLATAQDEEVSLYAVSEQNKYTVTFVVHDDEKYTAEYYYGDAIVPITAPELEGYTFAEWTDLPSTMPAEDITVYAEYTPNPYTITYFVNNEIFKTETYAFSESITMTEPEIPEGYYFTGWSERYSVMPAENISVYGELKLDTYTLTYVLNGETYLTETHFFGDELTDIDLSASGYTFTGWANLPATMPAEDFTVTAELTKNSYTLTYYVDGSVYFTETYFYGDSITLLADPAKTGHTFSGWSTAPETMPADNVEVIGTFTADTYTVTYVIDGEIYTVETYTYGEEVTPDEAPLKEGCTFSGWINLPDTMPAENITVTGVYTPNIYTVTYVLDSETYLTQSVAYGSELTAPTPSLVGYTFKGWENLPSTMPAENITVYGTTSVNTYTVTYMIDGEVYLEKDYSFGSAISVPVPESPKGYKFSGWSNLYATMPANDITVTGTYISTSSIVTVVSENGTVTGAPTEPVEEGDSVTLTVKAYDGYRFAGWYNGDSLVSTDAQYSFVPTGDITLTAKFVKYSTLSVVLSNGSSLNVKIGDLAPTPQSNFYKNSKLDMGTTVTLEAVSNKNNKFLYWIDEAGLIKCYDSTYSFIFIGETNVYAIFESSAIGDYRDVTFIGAYDQVLSSGFYSADDDITIPDSTQKTGYDFAGWSFDGETVISEDNLQSAIKSALIQGNVTLRAVYTAKPITYNVTVIGGKGTGDYLSAECITVYATTAPAGQKFAYWTKNGRIVSYTTSYTFYVSEDCTLEAVFVSAETEVTPTALTSIEQAIYDEDTCKLTFVSVSTVPDGAKIVSAGVIITDSKTVGTNSDLFNEDNSSCLYLTSSNADPTITLYRFSLTKKNVYDGDTWYARSYLVYYDEQGTLCTLYSDIVCAQVDGSGVILTSV